MLLGNVVGEITSTINHPIMENRKLLIVDKITPTGKPTGDYLIAIDTVEAGVGETVLLIDEGNSARQVLDAPNMPVRSVIVGIIDHIEL
jgi:ethanolamine utilization protein EutN